MGLLALTHEAEQMLRGLFEHGSLLLPDSWEVEEDCDRLTWFRPAGTVIVDVEPPAGGGLEDRDMHEACADEERKSAIVRPFPTLDSPPRRDVA